MKERKKERKKSIGTWFIDAYNVLEKCDMPCSRQGDKWGGEALCL